MGYRLAATIQPLQPRLQDPIEQMHRCGILYSEAVREFKNSSW